MRRLRWQSFMSLTDLEFGCVPNNFKSQMTNDQRQKDSALQYASLIHRSSQTFVTTFISHHQCPCASCRWVGLIDRPERSERTRSSYEACWTVRNRLHSEMQYLHMHTHFWSSPMVVPTLLSFLAVARNKAVSFMAIFAAGRGPTGVIGATA